MIQKWYEVTCDNCGTVINHYIGRKPYSFELLHDGAILKGNKQFCCNSCYNKYKKSNNGRK